MGNIPVIHEITTSVESLGDAISGNPQRARQRWSTYQETSIIGNAGEAVFTGSGKAATRLAKGAGKLGKTIVTVDGTFERVPGLQELGTSFESLGDAMGGDCKAARGRWKNWNSNSSLGKIGRGDFSAFLDMACDMDRTGAACVVVNFVRIVGEGNTLSTTEKCFGRMSGEVYDTTRYHVKRSGGDVSIQDPDDGKPSKGYIYWKDGTDAVADELNVDPAQFGIYTSATTYDMVVAFRGTDECKDWTGPNTLLTLGLEQFSDRFEESLKIVQALIRKHGAKWKVSVTGHSLGGALAMYCMIKCRRVSQAYTFNPAIMGVLSSLGSVLGGIVGGALTATGIKRALRDNRMHVAMFVADPVSIFALTKTNISHFKLLTDMKGSWMHSRENFY